LLAALGVYFRDMGQIVQFCSTALFYGSGIFYSAELVQKMSPAAWSILKFNPILLLIDEARRVALWGQPPEWKAVAYCYGTALLALLLGWWTFRKLKNGFADVV
jgi:lipopolysaccharide transport system permease protein